MTAAGRSSSSTRRAGWCAATALARASWRRCARATTSCCGLSRAVPRRPSGAPPRPWTPPARATPSRWPCRRAASRSCRCRRRARERRRPGAGLPVAPEPPARGGRRSGDGPVRRAGAGLRALRAPARPGSGAGRGPRGRAGRRGGGRAGAQRAAVDPSGAVGHAREPARLSGGRHAADPRLEHPRPALRHHPRGAGRGRAGRRRAGGVRDGLWPVLGLRGPG